MKLQTQIPFQPRSENLIDYQSKILLLGSCFVENIGNKLEYYKFQSVQNPFGILFHPKAIEKLVVSALKGKVYTDEDVFLHEELWHCFDAHSIMSNTSKEKLLKTLNHNLQITREYLLDVSHIVITLGTAWVYRDLESNSIVANCHKIPQKAFQKNVMSVADVLISLQNMLDVIRTVNPNATIIFTVSPVRHIKDGFIENTQSKSHLITAIHQLINNNATHNHAYFPSYELMMDELRDYRFYTEDMLHPNPLAITYIWEKFKQVWMSPEADQTMKAVEVIQKGLEHKPFNPKTEAHQKFLHELEIKKSALQLKYSKITF